MREVVFLAAAGLVVLWITWINRVDVPRATPPCATREDDNCVWRHGPRNFYRVAGETYWID